MSGAPGYRERSRVEKEAWIQREEQSGEGNLEKGGAAGFGWVPGYRGRSRVEKCTLIHGEN